MMCSYNGNRLGRRFVAAATMCLQSGSNTILPFSMLVTGYWILDTESRVEHPFTL